MRSDQYETAVQRVLVWETAGQLLRDNPTRLLTGFGPIVLDRLIAGHRPVALDALVSPAPCANAHNAAPQPPGKASDHDPPAIVSTIAPLLIWRAITLLLAHAGGSGEKTVRSRAKSHSSEGGNFCRRLNVLMLWRRSAL